MQILPVGMFTEVFPPCYPGFKKNRRRSVIIVNWLKKKKKNPNIVGMVVKSYNEEDSTPVERFYKSVVYSVEFKPQTLIFV